MGTSRFEGRVVVVGGSSSGIGAAVAAAFAGEGARVVANGCMNEQGLRHTVDRIHAAGAEGLGVLADLSTVDGARKLIEQSVEAYGTIDVLINNAGGASRTSFLDSTPDDWIRAFNGNLMTVVLPSQHVVPVMRNAGHGAIINTASIYGLFEGGRDTVMPYSAAKAAVINFTKTLAKMVAPVITVNAVVPGYVSVDADQDAPEQALDVLTRATPIKRWIRVPEMVDAYMYLAGVRAATGSLVTVDGGDTLK